jgi:hypothetical protein
MHGAHVSSSSYAPGDFYVLDYFDSGAAPIAFGLRSIICSTVTGSRLQKASARTEATVKPIGNITYTGANVRICLEQPNYMPPLLIAR